MTLCLDPDWSEPPDAADLFAAMCCSCSGQSFIVSSLGFSFGESCRGREKAGAVNRTAPTKAASINFTFRIYVPLVTLSPSAASLAAGESLAPHSSGQQLRRQQAGLTAAPVEHFDGGEPYRPAPPTNR